MLRKAATHSILILFALIAITSCNPAKKFVKKGDELAAKGDYENATGYYYTALLKNKNYKPAIDGLKVNAQKILNDKFEVYRNLVLENKLEQAIRQFDVNQKFYQNGLNVGVMLDWPEEFNDINNDIKAEYANKSFEEVIQLIKDKKFDIAEKRIQEIALLDTTFKGMTVLRMNSVLEPIYQNGVKQMAQSKFKEACESFNKVLQIDDQYKDATSLRNQALSNATIRYAILPVVTDKNDIANSFNELFRQQLIESTINYNSFLDYKATAKMLDSRGWQNIATIQQAVEAGRSLGLQFVIFTKIKVLVDTIYPGSKDLRYAYESFTENIPNPYTDTYSYITKFKKVTYTDVSKSQQLKYELYVAIVNCKDGSTTFSDFIEGNKMDELHKFEFNGVVNNLYQQLPEGNYLPPVNKEWREQFMGAKRSLSEKSVLQTSLLKELSNQAGFKIRKVLN